MVQGGVMVRVLGPVQLVMPDDEVIDLPSASQRRLLAALALHAPRPVRTEWLCDVLSVTPGALRTSVARLRKAVGEGVLHTSVIGYRLDAPVDALLACDELDRASDDPDAIRRALTRWVAPVLHEFAHEPWAVADAVRLAERRESAVEDLAEALIARRRPDEAVAALEPHVIAHPFRDRPRGLTIRALAAAGRQTEALRAFQAYRSFLAESVGNEPSEELRRIEQRVAAGWNGVHVVGHPDRPPVAEPVNVSRAFVPLSLPADPGLVGRRNELTVLAEVASRITDGGPLAILVSGEAGIGKTTLVAEFVHECCVPAGLSVLYGRCDEFVMEPFQPFRGVLGRLVDALPDDVLAAHTATCGGDLLRLLPQLESRVQVPARAVIGDEITARHLVFEAVVDLVRRAAGIGPLVLVIDDLHWAEPTGLQLLRHLVRNLDGLPVLFVVSFRDTGEAADDHLRAAVADLARRDAVRLELGGLDESELRDLVAARVAAAAGHDVAAVAELLRAETAGNPLFAEHLLRHWAGSELLTFDDGAVALAPEALTSVPATLRDLVWHRVMVLGNDTQPVLTAAAVLGVQFEEQVLATMTGIDEGDLGELLDRAVVAGVLSEDGSAPGTARFAHALVARSMDAELGSRSRTRLHAQAFQALLTTSSSVGRPARLARHAEQAGMLDEAQRWATAAGEHAFANLAPDEAVEWFGKALDHAAALGRPDAERADLLVRIGEAAYRSGHPTALDTLYEGAVLAELSGADATLYRAALATDAGSIQYGAFGPKQLAIAEAAFARLGDADLETRVRVTARFAQSLVQTDRTVRRRAAATEALELGRATGDPLLRARVAPDLLYAFWGLDLGSVRDTVAEEATTIVDDAGDPHLAWVVYHAAHTAAVCAGDAERASFCLERLRTLTRDVQEPRMRWTNGVVDAFDAMMRARFAEAEQIIAETFELGTQIGEPFTFPSFAAQTFVLGTFAGRHEELFPILQHSMDTQESVEVTFRIAYGIVCAELGRHEVPRAMLREAMDRGADAIPGDLVRSTTLLGYAILALETADVEAAAWLYPEVAPMAGEVAYNGVTSQGPAAAYAGRLASLLGRHDVAERSLLDALATTEAFGWEYHRTTTLIALAQNQFRRTGTLDESGRHWLDTGEELCARYGIASWAKRIDAVRAGLAPGTARPAVVRG